MSLEKRTIQNFYSTAQTQEFARNFQFRIVSLGPLVESDLIYFTTAQLPAKAINNVQVPYMGLQFNIPGTVNYPGSDSWAVTFRCDESANIRNQLLGWQTEVFSVASSTGKYGTPVELATVAQVGKDLLPIRQYNLHGIYPTNIGELSYDVTGGGDIMTFNATFAYQFWTEIGGPEQV